TNKKKREKQEKDKASQSSKNWIRSFSAEPFFINFFGIYRAGFDQYVPLLCRELLFAGFCYRNDCRHLPDFEKRRNPLQKPKSEGDVDRNPGNIVVSSYSSVCPNR